MPRTAIGTSSRTPESTSSAIDEASSTRMHVAERPHDLDRVAHERDVHAEEGECDEVDHPQRGGPRGVAPEHRRRAPAHEHEDRDREDAVPLDGTPACDERQHARARGGRRARRAGPASRSRLRMAWVANAKPTASRVSACANRAEPTKSRRARARCASPCRSVIATRPCGRGARGRRRDRGSSGHLGRRHPGRGHRRRIRRKRLGLPLPPLRRPGDRDEQQPAALDQEAALGEALADERDEQQQRHERGGRVGERAARRVPRPVDGEEPRAPERRRSRSTRTPTTPDDAELQPHVEPGVVRLQVLDAVAHGEAVERLDPRRPVADPAPAEPRSLRARVR